MTLTIEPRTMKPYQRTTAGFPARTLPEGNQPGTWETERYVSQELRSVMSNQALFGGDPNEGVEDEDLIQRSNPLPGDSPEEATAGDDDFYTVWLLRTQNGDRLFKKLGSEPRYCRNCGSHKPHILLIGSDGTRTRVCQRQWLALAGDGGLKRVRLRRVETMSVATDVYRGKRTWPEALSKLEEDLDTLTPSPVLAGEGMA